MCACGTTWSGGPMGSHTRMLFCYLHTCAAACWVCSDAPFFYRTLWAAVLSSFPDTSWASSPIAIAWPEGPSRSLQHQQRDPVGFMQGSFPRVAPQWEGNWTDTVSSNLQANSAEALSTRPSGASRSNTLAVHNTDHFNSPSWCCIFPVCPSCPLEQTSCLSCPLVLGAPKQRFLFTLSVTEKPKTSLVVSSDCG